jgi:hypothetical protein
MKLIKVTTETRAYTEEEAKEYIEKFRREALEHQYQVGAAGYTLKQKKKKGEVVADGYLVKTVAMHNEFWESEE